MTEKREWNRRFNGIGLKLEPQVVRVANDFVLDVYLQMDTRNSMRLAKYIRREYEKQFQEELNISAQSLAIEIYGHYKMQKAAQKAEEMLGRTRMTRWLIGHTDVIDCGSKEKDNNRVVWDSMQRIAMLEKKTGLTGLRSRYGKE
ncbi:MAG: hypothetical protein MJ116_01210 [Lachnospiraceae bacterium]|nr:hypothetical protein [Lachnospiraceae bacterium]